MSLNSTKDSVSDKRQHVKHSVGNNCTSETHPRLIILLQILMVRRL